MIADYAHQIGVELPPLSSDQVATLEAGLADLVNVINPLDMTVITMDDPAQIALCYETFAAGDFDVVATMLESYDGTDAPFADLNAQMIELFCDAARRHSMPAIVGARWPRRCRNGCGARP